MFLGCAPKQPAQPPAPAADSGEEESTDEASHVHHGGHHKFDDPEKWAKIFEAPEREAWQKPDEIIAGLALAKDAVIADIGAGTGYFAVRFAQAVPDGKVFANDIEASMTAYMGRRARRDGITNLFPVLGSAIDPALPEDVDVVFLCDVFHHIEHVDSFFLPVLRRLKPGGKLVIVDFKPEAPEDAPGPPANMRIAAQTVVSQLVELGFQEVSIDNTTLPYQYIAVLTH